ncbi:hypothetical protein SAMN05660662_4091 [Blastococcus aurantiacus]|uniref:Uncharacterized protein n=1 Tax=Blastococcus aurantiacus TaxID=1550231 RepID=A0A1G7QME1_9ACTN|nr:hypothetical protein [Blastococcus aurantiacus]SDF99652.1 hypothetical protein SAMN05660662_4091 [Blastococcus aurantiacus]
MRRRRRSVTVPVPGRDVDDAVQRLAALAARQRVRRPRNPGDLRIRLRGGGRVRVGRLSGTNTVFPVLRGRLEAPPGGGVQLTGTVTENEATLLVLAGQVFGLLVSVVLLALSVSAGSVSGGLVTGGLALLFVVVVWGLQRVRRDFVSDADALLSALDRALGRRR